MTHKTIRNIIILFLALTSFACESTILGTDKIKSPLPVTHNSRLATILDSLRYALDVPALSGAIVTDTSIIDFQAVGCRRYGGQMNITNNDLFHLGSNTKAITAVLIGILVDEQRVNWTTTLPEIFPEYAGTMLSDYQSVTVKDLLSHSSGFMRDPTRVFENGTPRNQRYELAGWAVTQPPAISRGTFLYSNLGYMIAGAIAEKLMNKEYEELLIEKVLLPLGISSAGFGPMGTPGLEDQPLQHTYSHAPIEPYPYTDNPPVYSPAGRLHISIGDWAKFIQWVLAAENGHQTLVSAQTAAMLTSSIVPTGSEDYYGCGWQITSREWAGGRALIHGGTNGVNYSEAALAPGRKFGVIVASNQGPGNSANPVDPVAARLINYYLNELNAGLKNR
ncbi:MAG: serine hydrolase [Ignavibacteria bacterium]|nr:serine hydrolase [Ignavibacteria bacterium]